MVPNRTRATLLAIIEEVCLPGTHIMSDSFGTYRHGAINAIPVIPPYVHTMENHRRNFVDPLDGTHTNCVENFWKNIKMKFKIMAGVQRTVLESLLAEYMWRQLHGKKSSAVFDNMIRLISEYYPVN